MLVKVGNLLIVLVILITYKLHNIMGCLLIILQWECFIQRILIGSTNVNFIAVVLIVNN